MDGRDLEPSDWLHQGDRMKRRSILKAMLLAPLAPLLGLLPAPAVAQTGRMGFIGWDPSGQKVTMTYCLVGPSGKYEIIQVKEYTLHGDRMVLEVVRGKIDG